jgi:phenylalanine-4-hydroxylase
VVSGAAEIRPFDLLEVFRTPYRIDIVQPVYFQIESFEALAAALHSDIPAVLEEAARLGDLPARFEQTAA